MNEVFEAIIKPVTKIPDSKGMEKKGKSKYDNVLAQLLELEVNKPVEISHPTLSLNSFYSAISKIIQRKKIKNLRLVTRRNRFFAERMY